MHKRKLGILLCLAAYALFILPLTGCASVPGGRAAVFREGTAPWIVLNDPSGRSVTICWLSPGLAATRMLFGDEESTSLIEGSGFPTRIHRLTVAELEPGKTYRYLPVRGENPETPDSRTSFYEFTAPPEKDAPVRILVVGDMQPKPKEAVTIHGGALVAAGIVREKPDLVVQLGDLSYIGGFFNYWFPLLQNISAFSPFVPMQAVPGNHDQYVDGGRNYAEFFPYDFASGKGLYYSFNIGSAHFVMINAFEKGDEKITDTQKEWVERDIAAARESGMEWIFLAVHDCVLSTGTEGTSEPLLAWIVPLADRMDVDAVFYGHDHHYEHWLVEYGKNGLVFDPADTPLGNPVQYFCAGGGGGRLEVDYGLMTREPASFVRRMYRLPGGEPFDLEIAQNPWDSSVYIDRTDNPDYGQPFGGKHYYQAPPGPTCQTDTAWFGYEYGEQTLHYILIEIEGNEARISVRYPNGDLLAGPDGRYPQEFILTRD